MDLPRLDEKLVKTYLNFQPQENNPENQSPAMLVGSEEKHIPWQISSCMDGKRCKICGTIGQTKHDIFRHIRNVHLKSKLFQCNNCDFGTERMGLLKVHFKTIHANEKCKQTAAVNDNIVIDTTKPSVTINKDMSIQEILAMDLSETSTVIPAAGGGKFRENDFTNKNVISKSADLIQCEVCNYVPQSNNGKSAKRKHLDTHYKSQKHINTWKKIMEESEIFEKSMFLEEEEKNKSQIPSIDDESFQNSFENSFQNSSTNDSGFVEQEISMGEQTIILDKDNSNETETKIDSTTKIITKPEKFDVVIEEENRFSCVLSYQCHQKFQTTHDVENHGQKFHKSLGICKKDINELLLADFLKSESKRLKTFTGIYIQFFVYSINLYRLDRLLF